VNVNIYYTPKEIMEEAAKLKNYSDAIYKMYADFGFCNIDRQEVRKALQKLAQAVADDQEALNSILENKQIIK
jgi:uncharacterized protein YukE